MFYQDTNEFYRIEDESALRAKVDEAMSVYNDYVKTQGDGEAEPAKKEEKAEEKA